MRNACRIFVIVVVLVIAFAPVHAVTLHEDVAYWYTEGDQILTIFNPSTDWLAENIPTGRVLVKVQQTVYDPVSTLSILKRNGDGTNHPGYLFSYTVTNLNVGNPDDLSDIGITKFAVDWDMDPLYATVARHAPLGWVVDTEAGPSPAWKWTGAGPGLLPGNSVGGFWAVADTGVERVTIANGLHVVGPQQFVISGDTTGPAPEAPTVLSLATGVVGLSVVRRFRRRR